MRTEPFKFTLTIEKAEEEISKLMYAVDYIQDCMESSECNTEAKDALGEALSKLNKEKASLQKRVKEVVDAFKSTHEFDWVMPVKEMNSNG